MLCLSRTFSMSSLFCVNQRSWGRRLMPQSSVCEPCGPFGFETGLHKHLPERRPEPRSPVQLLLPTGITAESNNPCREQQKVRLCPWMLLKSPRLASPSCELHQHTAKPHCWHLDYSNTTSYWYFLEYYTTFRQSNPSWMKADNFLWARWIPVLSSLSG